MGRSERTPARATNPDNGFFKNRATDRTIQDYCNVIAWFGDSTNVNSALGSRIERRRNISEINFRFFSVANGNFISASATCQQSRLTDRKEE